jgi:hypothetical protein
VKVRTKRYVMTVNKGNLAEEYRLDIVRDTVKFFNKHTDRKFYVKCHGRFGKNNPNLANYILPNGAINYSECRLEDAQRVDVYIHER